MFQQSVVPAVCSRSISQLGKALFILATKYLLRFAHLVRRALSYAERNLIDSKLFDTIKLGCVVIQGR